MGTLLVCGGDQRSARRAPVDANSLERSYPQRGGGTVAETTLISIVDDDKLVRKSIETLIKSCGFRVQAFASAEDFLRYGNHRDTACLILTRNEWPGAAATVSRLTQPSPDYLRFG